MATGLGIDIGTEHIKVVQARVSNSTVLVTAAYKIPRKGDLGPEGPEDTTGSLSIPETLGKDLKGAGLRR
ncbi:MAG: hypothetical protein ABSE73_19440, partial [Planctomycetota bacterium]